MNDTLTLEEHFYPKVLIENMIKLRFYSEVEVLQIITVDLSYLAVSIFRVFGGLPLL